MAHNPPVDVQALGQSIWLDYIHRQSLQDGELRELIDNFGVVGMTSNPAIFQQAIGESHVYDDTITTMLDLEPYDIYESLAIADIQNAADLLQPVYERSGGRDGFVSLEVSPLIADDTRSTIEEAQRLFKTVGRPNTMIKIPGTEAGLPAIEESIAAGLNINVTLLFSVENYEAVAEAFIRGLERRLDAGADVRHVASVASFFLSRIDVMVDQILENNIRAAQGRDINRVSANRKLLGKAAIANAKLAYQRFEHLFYGERFARLRAAGAQVQRPLWASTGAKNPNYPDTMYVDNLIARDTVNTMPPKTLTAFHDHGSVQPMTRDEGPSPQDIIDMLAEVGVNFDDVTHQLQIDGVDQFVRAFNNLLEQVEAKRTILQTGVIQQQKTALSVHSEQVEEALDLLDGDFTNARIWSKDGTLWKSHAPTIDEIRHRLGWLDVLETIDRDRLRALQNSVRGGDIDHVVLLGMGGSSLAPEVLRGTFGRQPDFPDFLMLDSTDPQSIRAVESAIDLDRTLFLVSSKSGGTLETLSFFKYFYRQSGGNGARFIAVTDPGSDLQRLAEEHGFRDIFLNPADIGGRYSALSYFGMVPAALMGLHLDALWSNAERMFRACGESIPARLHPGITLGAILGVLGTQGRDKITIFCSESVARFGDWVEQLIAESTGKEGGGLVPVVGATVGNPHDYESDPLFIYLRVDGDPDVTQMDARVRALREAGHPRVTLRLDDRYALAGEFFRWEFATAVAGKVLGINPFDEPNVVESKQITARLLEAHGRNGGLPAPEPAFVEGNVSLYADDYTLRQLRELCQKHNYNSEEMSGVLAAQINGTSAGDYFALQAFLPLQSESDALLHDIRRRLRHVTKRAVTLGYGPRYLHSTGQLHKGGANNGVFIQLTHDTREDLAIPDAPYGFGTLLAAQAAGDLRALVEKKRRAIRLHIEGDAGQGLQKLMDAIELAQERRH